MLLRFVLLLAALPLTAAEPPRVLFVGNSYTYFNDLPTVVATLSQEVGAPLKTDSLTGPGYRLSKHLSEPLLEAKLAEGTWDAIVLQGQSLAALERPDELAQSVAAIKKMAGDTPLYLFQTWARAARPEMTASIKETYDRIAQNNDAQVLRVGEVWALVHGAQPQIGLYTEDGSHPSPTGTYLTALVMVTQLLGKTPENRSSGGLALPEEAVREALQTRVSELARSMHLHKHPLVR